MPRSTAHPRPLAALAAGVALTLISLVPAAAQTTATSPTSPVNLATPVNFGQAIANHDATVVAGDARFEVLGTGLIRLEYSPTGNFENLPTVNVLSGLYHVDGQRVAHDTDR